MKHDNCHSNYCFGSLILICLTGGDRFYYLRCGAETGVEGREVLYLGKKFQGFELRIFRLLIRHSYHTTELQDSSIKWQWSEGRW